MEEEDGDDFGPLYFDILKPCSSVKEANFISDQNPSSFHAGSDLSANVSKDLKEYDALLLSECGGGLGGEFDDVIFDVEMEQNEVEFDSRGLVFEGKNDKIVEENKVNVLGDMMDEDDDDLQTYAGIPQSFDMVYEHNENGVEDLKGSTHDDISVNEEDSESDESFKIIIQDSGLNDDGVGSDDKKYVEMRELGLTKNVYDPYDSDELEPGEIPGIKAELGTHVEARVGHSNQSFHAVSKGVRSVFTSTVDAHSKGEQNQVNPVRNAAYNYGITRFRHLPVFFKKAFNIEDDYSGFKPWTRHGVNLSDFFNFDLDGENWQKYCKQMKQLLQTSPPSKAVGYKSEQLQLEKKNTLGQQMGEAIKVHITHGERVACQKNHHRRECDSDEIIEIVFVDSADDTKSFTKDLRDHALHKYETRPTTIHKIINGDKILPFPLDGYFHQISLKERTSQRVSINYAQEGRQWTDSESMVSKKKDHISNQGHPKERTEAQQGLRGELKYDKVMPLHSKKDVSKNNEGQTTVRNRPEDDRFHITEEKSWRQGYSNYKKSLKQPDESKPTPNVYDNKKITGNGFDNCRMRIEETLSQTDHQEGNNDNKLNNGSAVDEYSCRMRTEETSSQTDHPEENYDNKLNKESALDEDNCGMKIEEILSQTDHQEGNNDNKFHKGSAVDEDNFKMIVEETSSQTYHQEGNNDYKLNEGSVVGEYNMGMRIEETLSQTNHQERNNDNKLNKGSAVVEDNCRMRIKETLSQTDHQEGDNDQEGNNDSKLNKGCAVDEDFNGEQVTESIDNPEKEFPNNKLGNNVNFDDQSHEAKRGENADEESKKLQGSPKAGESDIVDMKQLMSNIKELISEIDELVVGHKHEHRICCLK